jgi:hypothetical protein
VLINPNNPTGALYPDDLLREIIEIARQHQLIIFADEIYDKVLYDGATHTSVASLADDVLFVTFNGLSKNYRACGYRAGWMVVSGEKRRARLHRGPRHAGLDAPVLQRARPVRHPDGAGRLPEHRRTGRAGRPLARQRDLAWELLTQIPGVTCVKPKAALYMFPRLDPKMYPIADDQQFILELLLEKRCCWCRAAASTGRRPTTSASSSCPTKTTCARPSAASRASSSTTASDVTATAPTEFRQRAADESVAGVSTCWRSTPARNHETHQCRPARHRHRRRRHLHRSPAQRRGDHPPRRPADPHHRRRRQEPRTGEARSPAAPAATDDAFAVVADPEVDIVVELIGGYGVAKELVLKAIENGKHVVTANKALLATHGNEIFAAAQKKGVMVAFEAAVAGGIPIIKALREGLTANRIEWIAGIINGTTNFILSEMRDKGLPFETVLKEAQRLGYAEADPTFDIEGVDAAHKLTIMSAIAFGIPMQFDKAHIEGISKLQPRTSSTPSSSATASSCSASPSASRGHRAARAPDADPGEAPDRQRRRRHERRAGEGRRRRRHALLRQGRRRRADRQRRDRRPGRRHPHAHRRPGAPRAAPGLPARRCPTPVLPMDEVETSYYLRCASRTAPACWPTSRASSPTSRSRSTP